MTCLQASATPHLNPVASEQPPDLTNLPTEYHNLKMVFRKSRAVSLSPTTHLMTAPQTCFRAPLFQKADFIPCCPRNVRPWAPDGARQTPSSYRLVYTHLTVGISKVPGICKLLLPLYQRLQLHHRSLNNSDLSLDTILLESGNQESLLGAQEMVHIGPYPHHTRTVTLICHSG